MRFDTPGPLLLDLWSRLSRVPGGRRAFSWLLGRMVPYSGTVRARVVSLAPGEVELLLPDRRRVRNHLASVHAVALVNLGELASGLAITTALPDGVRGIPVRLETEFVRKARGDIVAHARFLAGEIRGDTDVTLQVPLLDADDEVVATVTATWRLRGTAATEAHPARLEGVARPPGATGG